jgi:hypothetical protein
MSIDSRHQQKLYELGNLETEIKTYENKIRKLQKEKAGITDVFTILQLDDEIHQCNNKIHALRTSTQTDYIMKVSSVLKDHHETFRPDTQFSKMSTSDADSICNYVEKRTENKRGQLLTAYRQLIDGDVDYKPVIQPSMNGSQGIVCKDCGVSMRLSMNESYVVCERCGNYDVYFEPSVSGLTYEQELNTDTSVHFAYKRINHLRELLAQLQAKERSELPPEVIAMVQAEFKKARVTNPNDITQTKVKAYLKKLNLNKYYEHARQLTNILSGKPPPVISGELYDTLINMFHDIQEPFEQVCPKGRKNFFSYNYILYKFCELLGENEMMPLFPLLKSRDKLYQQDCIWRDICRITGWTFYKSV